MGLAQASASLGSLAGCQGSAEQRVLPQVVSGGRWTAGPNVSSPFEASSSMALSAFTLLCNHHLHPSPEPCCFPTESLAPLSSNPPSPRPLSSLSLCVCSGGLQEWTHGTCSFASGLCH